MGLTTPKIPKNWPTKRKWLTVVPMSLFNFIAAMFSAAAAPVLSELQKELEIRSSTLLIMVLSIFLLGSAVIPLFTGPLSEIFGRVIVLQLTNMFYLIFNTACGAAKTQNQLITFRFLAGFGRFRSSSCWYSPYSLPCLNDVTQKMLMITSYRSAVASSATCFNLTNEAKLLQSTPLHRYSAPSSDLSQVAS
jgi:MFS family permease